MKVSSLAGLHVLSSVTSCFRASVSSSLIVSFWETGFCHEVGVTSSILTRAGGTHIGENMSEFVGHFPERPQRYRDSHLSSRRKTNAQVPAQTAPPQSRTGTFAKNREIGLRPVIGHRNIGCDNHIWHCFRIPHYHPCSRSHFIREAVGNDRVDGNKHGT